MRSSPFQSRAGLTLVECLVALVLLALGVLGAAGVVASSWRLHRAGELAAEASRRLATVADSLALAARQECGRLVGGSASERGVTITWSISSPGEADLVASYAPLGGTRTDSVNVRVPCA